MFYHTSIVWVHGDFGLEFIAQVGGIAAVVKISMCEDDEIEVTGRTTGFVYCVDDGSAFAGWSRVDQRVSSAAL